jgi:hypothetical protein
VGIISLTDIATAAERRGLEAPTGELAPTEISSTLANICHPRQRSPESALF